MSQQIKDRAFRLGFSGTVSKPPYAANTGNGFVVSDNGKAKAMTFAGEW
jgi:hypothetical protein